MLKSSIVEHGQSAGMALLTVGHAAQAMSPAAFCDQLIHSIVFRESGRHAEGRLEQMACNAGLRHGCHKDKISMWVLQGAGSDLADKTAVLGMT